jgi:hypothetical protein
MDEECLERIERDLMKKIVKKHQRMRSSDKTSGKFTARDLKI